MGIPSYFKHLTRSVDGLLLKTAPNKVSWLCFDFNCLIYHVLQRPGIGSEGGPDWEAHLLDEVAKYAMKVVRHVGPVDGVFLAVDGVVPMAKIKQQRMRRFKGALVEGFSKNAITPGTDFMKRLGARLTKMAADHKDIRWRLSLSNEPGEGEHKILNFLRKMDSPDKIVIYGLDADLIVLSLIAILEKKIRSLWLFREIVEGNSGIKRNAIGEEEFHFFAIDEFAKYIRGRSGGGDGYMADYCNGMMLLGNDFLPTSMTFRIREEGHEDLCRLIGQIRSANGLGEMEETPITNLVVGIFEGLARDEEERFHRACRRKLDAKLRHGDDEEGPIHWRGDEIFYDGRRLRGDWRDIYYGKCLGGVEKERVVAEYWKGMKWVLNYYKGAPVNMAWMYPWHYAPLWEDVLQGFWVDDVEECAPITETEQLALVLPLWDWHLIPLGAKERAIPRLAPEWFPEKFGLSHIGRMWLWECEPELPVPGVQALRARLMAC